MQQMDEESDGEVQQLEDIGFEFVQEKKQKKQVAMASSKPPAREK